MSNTNDNSTRQISRGAWLPALIGAAAGATFFAVFLPFQTTWLGRVISGWPSHWPNLLSLMAFGVAMALLIDRMRSLAWQRKAFSMNLLGDDTDTLLLPEDALEARKRLRQLGDGDRNLVLIRLLDAGLQRARANWSAEDVGTAVKTEAELVGGDVEAEYSTIRYLAWAIPSIGFIGTVLGIGDAMGFFGGEADSTDISGAASALSMAFDTTFVALLLSLVLMYFLHRVQAKDDGFLVDATSWCMRRFVYRMHIPEEHPT